MGVDELEDLGNFLEMTDQEKTEIFLEKDAKTWRSRKEGSGDTPSITLDFQEKSISKIAFARTKDEADRLERQLGLSIYFPSELANWGDEIPMYVLAG